MDIEIKEINPYDVNWNSLVKSVPEGTVYQTTYWAKYLQRYIKAEPVFLIAQDRSGRILGSLLLYRTRFFKKLLKLGPLGDLVSRVINKSMAVITWSFGPLVYDKSNFDEIFRCILINAVKMMSNKGVVFLKDITIPIHGDKDCMKKAHSILSDLSFKQKEFVTIFIDLRKDENELWADLKNSARKALKKFNGSEFNILSLGKEGLDGYRNLLLESRKRSGIELPPIYPSYDMWDELNGDTNILDILSVNKDDRFLGAIGTLNFNNVVFETGPAQSDYSFENKIYVNDILKWHVIKNAKSRGARLYDLCGIFSNPKNEKEKSLNQFKEKWGGEKVCYNLYYKFLWQPPVS